MIDRILRCTKLDSVLKILNTFGAIKLITTVKCTPRCIGSPFVLREKAANMAIGTAGDAFLTRNIAIGTAAVGTRLCNHVYNTVTNKVSTRWVAAVQQLTEPAVLSNSTLHTHN